MAQCPTHPEIHVPPGKICIMCSRENLAAWKDSEKNKVKEAKVIRLKSNGPSGNLLTKLKDKLQAEWRMKIYPYYEERGLVSVCWACGNHIRAVGQVSHFFDKGTNPYLWTRPENSGICHYQCNVVNPHTAPRMITKMLEVWGDERINKLLADQKEYDLKIKTGQLKRWPDELWLRAMIIETRKMIIQ